MTDLPFDGQRFAGVAEALQTVEADVVIDYTSSTAVAANVRAAIEAGSHVVIGSSGLTSEDYAELDTLAKEHSVGVVASGNFAILAAILTRAAVMAAEHVDRWEIVDYASDQKPDVPSGTSRELAETLGAVRTPVTSVELQDLHGPVEARGAGVAGTRIPCVRPATSSRPRSSLPQPGRGSHPGLSPDPYVAGTLLAVRAVSTTTGLTRGLDSLLP